MGSKNECIFGTHACKVQVFWFVVAMLASSQVIQAFLDEYYFRWSFIKLLQEVYLFNMYAWDLSIYKFFTFMIANECLRKLVLLARTPTSWNAGNWYYFNIQIISFSDSSPPFPFFYELLEVDIYLHCWLFSLFEHSAWIVPL